MQLKQLKTQYHCLLYFENFDRYEKYDTPIKLVDLDRISRCVV